MRKSSQQFRETDNRFRFLDPENIWSNFMENRYFVKIALSYWENQVNNFEIVDPENLRRGCIAESFVKKRIDETFRYSVTNYLVTVTSFP